MGGAEALGASGLADDQAGSSLGDPELLTLDHHGPAPAVQR